jgi:hypothetical protein
MVYLLRKIHHVVFYGLAMKKALSGLFLISILLFPASAKANPSNQIVRGKQYVVLGGGARPLADNSIFYRSCNYKNECEEFELSYRKVIAQETDDLAILDRMINLMKELNKSGGVEVVKTDFEGNYSFKCPTAKCLVYSDGKAGLANAYWLKTVKSNSKVDLTGSNAIHIYNSRN